MFSSSTSAWGRGFAYNLFSVMPWLTRPPRFHDVFGTHATGTSGFLPVPGGSLSQALLKFLDYFLETLLFFFKPSYKTGIFAAPSGLCFVCLLPTSGTPNCSPDHRIMKWQQGECGAEQTYRLAVATPTGTLLRGAPLLVCWHLGLEEGEFPELCVSECAGSSASQVRCRPWLMRSCL